MQDLLAQAQEELNLKEGEYTMWVPDLPDMPPQSSAIVMIAQAKQPPNVVNNTGRTLGVCELVSANQGERTQLEISPGQDATQYLWRFDKNTEANFGDGKVTILQKPKHGRLTNDVWDAAKGDFVPQPADARQFDLNQYQYLPEKDYDGKDFAVMQVEKNGIKIKIHYFIHVSSEVNASYLCERKNGPWKISQSANPDVGAIDFASLQRSDDLSALIANASQSLSGFQNLAGNAVGNTVGEGKDATITLDNDAAGHGWFVDATPTDNSEYLPPLTPTSGKPKPVVLPKARWTCSPSSCTNTATP